MSLEPLPRAGGGGPDRSRAPHPGDFFIIEYSSEKVVLGNRACPFGDMVKGRPALCMMTSNVFGLITAESLGDARVDIQQAIAQGDAGCRVVVYLKPAPDGADVVGNELFRDHVERVWRESAKLVNEPESPRRAVERLLLKRVRR